jgi:hypothetical protein
MRLIAIDNERSEYAFGIDNNVPALRLDGYDPLHQLFPDGIGQPAAFEEC